jgi:hypothetical protein
MYQSGQQPGGQTPPAGDAGNNGGDGPSGGDDEVTDVDFEEVNDK